jgi:hypothetical protein
VIKVPEIGQLFSVGLEVPSTSPGIRSMRAPSRSMNGLSAARGSW